MGNSNDLDIVQAGNFASLADEALETYHPIEKN
jgi:hypothetical protein